MDVESILKMLQTTIYGLIILCIGRFMPGGSNFVLRIKNTKFLSFLSKEHHEYMIDKLEKSAIRSAAKAISLQDILGTRTLNSQIPILECEHITKSFGGNVALDDVSFTIKQGEIVGLIGAKWKFRKNYFIQLYFWGI
jgi:branched-chain amino acid transport system permease protein